MDSPVVFIAADEPPLKWELTVHVTASNAIGATPHLKPSFPAPSAAGKKAFETQFFTPSSVIAATKKFAAPNSKSQKKHNSTLSAIIPTNSVDSFGGIL